MDGGRVVLEDARRFQNIESDLENAVRELRDNHAGRLAIGANDQHLCIRFNMSSTTAALFPK